MESTKSYYNNLKQMVSKIEQMKKPNPIGVLRILMKENESCINENKNGIYVNLSEVNPETILCIQQFLDYIDFQEANLTSIEAKQQDVKCTLSQNYI